MSHPGTIKILPKSEWLESTFDPPRNEVYTILTKARDDHDTFLRLAKENKTIASSLSFQDLLTWLHDANEALRMITLRTRWSDLQSQTKFGFGSVADATYDDFKLHHDLYDALQLTQEILLHSPDTQEQLAKLSLIEKEVTSTKQTVPTASKEVDALPLPPIQSEATLNSVPIELNFKQKHNLQDPLLDLEVKVNNPIGRLWLAIKRMWKAQKTIVSLRFTIPLLVLPIILFAGYRLWLGRGVSVPLAKVGILHQVVIQQEVKDILILPSSDVYLLSYSTALPSTLAINKYMDTTVVVFGTYNHLRNELTVEKLAPYDIKKGDNPIPYGPLPSTPLGQTVIQTMISDIWKPIEHFFAIFY